MNIANYRSPSDYYKALLQLLPIKEFKGNVGLNKQDKQYKAVYRWTQYFRRYPAQLAKLYGLHLHPFQEYILTMWFRNNYGMYIAARGQGKTYLMAVFCLLKMILYPNIKIVVAGGVKSQAAKIVTEKIPQILLQAPLFNNEIAEIKNNLNTVDYNLRMHNGSLLHIVAATDNARSGRAQILICDEFRMIKKEVYSTVLKRFLTDSRLVGYRFKPEWKDYPLERNQEFFLSSAYLKSNWSWEKLQAHLKQMVRGKKYSLVAFPYQISIKYKLLNPEQILDEAEESDFNPLLFQMEMECQFYGQSDKAFFKDKELYESRRIPYPVYPRAYYEKPLIKDKKFRPDLRKNGEIRLLCVDIATMAGKANDASAFILLRLIPDKRGYLRQVSYIETMEGGHTQTQALNINRLYYGLDCDYIVLDRQNAGIGVYDTLVLPLYDPEIGITYDPLCSINDEEMVARCPYNDAERVIYTIAASESFNDKIARELKDALMRHRIELLGDSEVAQTYFDSFPNYFELPAEVKNTLKSPYDETESLILEMVQLEKSFGNTSQAYLRLKTVGKNRKDRYTALAYGNYIANELERNNFKPSDNLTLVEGFARLNGSSSIGGQRTSLRNKFII